MKLTELKDALLTALEPINLPRYAQPLYRIKDKLPVIQVLLLPGTMAPAAAGAHTDRTILVDIGYVSKDEPDYIELYTALERIDELIRPVLKVPVAGDKPRFLTVYSANMSITDNIAHYIFTLEFTQAEDRPSLYTDLMQELILEVTLSCPP